MTEIDEFLIGTPIIKKFQKIPYIFLSIWHFIGTPQKKSFKEIISNFT